MLMIDFLRDTVGLHVNGRARVVENQELLQYAEKLPPDVIDEINQEGKKCPERWVVVEVKEAYIQCSKHIPLLKKAEKAIDWGTDSVAAKAVVALDNDQLSEESFQSFRSVWQIVRDVIGECSRSLATESAAESQFPPDNELANRLAT
jgi:hypothetical protein